MLIWVMQRVACSFVPAIVRTGYAKLKDFLAKQVQPPQPGEQPSMMPKCSIM